MYFIIIINWWLLYQRIIGTLFQANVFIGIWRKGKVLKSKTNIHRISLTVSDNCKAKVIYVHVNTNLIEFTSVFEKNFCKIHKSLWTIKENRRRKSTSSRKITALVFLERERNFVDILPLKNKKVYFWPYRFESTFSVTKLQV